MSPILDRGFAGEALGAGVAEAIAAASFLRDRLLGEAEGEGLIPAEAEGLASAFLRERLAGDAEALAEGEGEVAASVFFLERGAFGEAEPSGEGDCAKAKLAPVTAQTTSRRMFLRRMGAA